MMRVILPLQILLYASKTFSQHVINYEDPGKGDTYLTTQIAIPKVSPGYTVWLPDSGNINGLIVFTHARRDTLKSEFIIDYASEKQLAVLYTTTDNRLEFFFEEDKLQEIESYIHQITSSYGIPEDHLLYYGMSLEGTRALKLTMFGQSTQSKYHLKPKAVAICDSPLDMVRLYKEMVKAKLLNYTPLTANEGTWISGYLESNLGGTPNDTLSAYINYSPYCYIADGGPHIKTFNTIAIRAYTESDVNWWIDTRRKDYHSMNSIDLAASINALKISGNENAELIITNNKGYDPNGTRHPHSWSIVDEKDLIDSFIKMIH